MSTYAIERLKGLENEEWSPGDCRAIRAALPKLLAVVEAAGKVSDEIEQGHLQVDS